MNNISIKTSSYIFDGKIANFLQSDDRVFVSPRGTYINRGVLFETQHSELKSILGEMKFDADAYIESDIKPFIVFAKHFKDTPKTDSTIDIPCEMIHIDSNNRITHFYLSASKAGLLSDTPSEFTYPKTIEIVSEESREEFCEKIEIATKKIANSDLEKVVLARQIKMKSDSDFDSRLIISELISTQPGCYVYSVDNFIGASPELLVEKFSRTISLLPMAGTRKRHAHVGDDDIDVADLQTNAKDLSEHAFLIENILEKLNGVAYDIAASASPKVIRLPHVSHLVTPINASVASDVDLFQLIDLLHPTPAVGGTPLNSALETIDALENFDREVYGAPVGWVDSSGDGQCAIALRCAKIEDNVATLFAGVGIVLESDPEDEFNETQAKFGPMRDALLNIVR